MTNSIVSNVYDEERNIRRQTIKGSTWVQTDFYYDNRDRLTTKHVTIFKVGSNPAIIDNDYIIYYSYDDDNLIMELYSDGSYKKYDYYYENGIKVYLDMICYDRPSDSTETSHTEFNEFGKVTYVRYSDGLEEWNEYDESGNLISIDRTDGYCIEL